MYVRVQKVSADAPLYQAKSAYRPGRAASCIEAAVLNIAVGERIGGDDLNIKISD